MRIILVIIFVPFRRLETLTFRSRVVAYIVFLNTSSSLIFSLDKVMSIKFDETIETKQSIDYNGL